MYGNTEYEKHTNVVKLYHQLEEVLCSGAEEFVYLKVSLSW